MTAEPKRREYQLSFRERLLVVTIADIVTVSHFGQGEW